MLTNYLMEKKECNKIRAQLRRVREKRKEQKNSTGCRIFLRLKTYQNKPDTFYNARLRASSNKSLFSTYLNNSSE